MATCFSALHRRRSGAWLLAIVWVGLGAMGAGGQQDQGVEVLKEGTVGGASSIGDLIFEPFRVSALLGSSVGGSPWVELSAGAGLWWGNLRVAGDGHLRGTTLTLEAEAETQFEHLSLFAGARVTNTANPLQLSAGARTRIENFNLSARVAVDNGMSLQLNAATRLESMEAFVGAGLAGGAANFTAGVTLPGDPMTLSGALTWGGAGLDVSGGADLAVAESFSLYANAGFGGGEVRASGGARLATPFVQLNALGMWGTNSGLGAIAQGEINLGPLSAFGIVRMDADSVSSDVGGRLTLGNLDVALTVGFDQQGYKWVQLQISAQFGG